MKINHFVLTSLLFVRLLERCSSSQTASTEDPCGSTPPPTPNPPPHPTPPKIAGEDVSLSELTYQFICSGARPEAGFTPERRNSGIKEHFYRFTIRLSGQKLAEAEVGRIFFGNA